MNRCSLVRLLLTFIAALSFPIAASAVVPHIPTVEGPITGPGPMHPGIRPGPEGTNLEDFGYVTQEYFVSGNAGPTAASYKVRLLVRRPADPAAFSGMVLGEPTHRGGNALICQFARFGIGKRGHVCADVMARPINLSNPATAGAGLREFNLARYESLHVASNQTNEILAQVGRLLRSNPPIGPLAGYPVRTLVMGGTSDASGAVRAFMETIPSDPSIRRTDHSTLRMPDDGPIYQGFFVTSTLGSAPVARTDVPTIQMPSQSEVHGTNGYRRPDSDVPGNQFRIYEVSGMSHNDARENPAFVGCTNPLSHFPHGALTFMGLQHTLDWAAHGTIPPRAAYMEVDNDLSDGTRVALDEHGNARGGVRSTYLDVPAFTFTIPNSGPGLCSQTGWITPFSAEKMADLYRNHGGYVSRIQHRLKQLMEDGWFPREYADEYVRADIQRAN